MPNEDDYTAYTNTTAEELARHMDVWDQAIGCNICGSAQWGENYTQDPSLFHAEDCPCFGRRDVAAFVFNVARIEEENGYPIGK